ncbi:uncharacterized protein LACBIDRAFT_335953 [Laccaria bicolor S238N-H82]|uniref:Predicted protein n=1 Tax=Laccaria bicolor (strain S238N-H82 / ATCC MYA-4686) TaxID=486041 RepID=B0E3X9_LACBS|nr:uncharacterized protein LACBIDRAFT_335953 [Laccaria bicolor S238N-H82]EDQ98451.1 predicted protein [Laccaria bicolor S238N-H82]|eukprot:XP_001890897.1 predicted protein [Laccaria bicolor S238N-H82]
MYIPTKSTQSTPISSMDTDGGCTSEDYPVQYLIDGELGGSKGTSANHSTVVAVLVLDGRMSEMVYDGPMAKMVYDRPMARIYKREIGFLLGYRLEFNYTVVKMTTFQEAAVGAQLGKFGKGFRVETRLYTRSSSSQSSSDCVSVSELSPCFSLASLGTSPSGDESVIELTVSYCVHLCLTCVLGPNGRFLPTITMASTTSRTSTPLSTLPSLSSSPTSVTLTLASTVQEGNSGASTPVYPPPPPSTPLIPNILPHETAVQPRAQPKRYLMTSGQEDEFKINYFETWLKSGSAAEQWFKDLEVAKKATWAGLCVAFKEQWPEWPTAQKTTAEKQAELEGEKITEAELGTKVKVNGTEMYAHVAWANKVEKLAKAVPDNNNLLVVSCRRQLPPTLKVLRSVPSDHWILRRRKNDKTSRHDSRENYTLGQAFRNFSVGPIPQPRFQPAPAATQATTQPYRGPQRTDAEKLVIIGHIPPPQPDTPAGWAAYEAELATWNCISYGRPANESRPCPLTPGTSPVASGKCFGCGHTGHPGAACTSNRRIPDAERAWCQKANSIRTGASRANNYNVNLVDEDDVFLTRDEYEAAIISRYLASQNQGNGEGPSAS